MKYIFRIFIVLMITLTTSSCFENTVGLQIRGVLWGTEDNDSNVCSYEFDMEGGTFLSDEGTMMDLAYTKLAGAYTHNYGYTLPIGVINTLPNEMKTRSEVGGTVNSIEVKSVVIKVYTDQNVLVDTDVITKSRIVDPQTTSILYIPVFRNVLKWEGDTEDTSRNFLYSSLYDNDGGNGLLTRYVTVDIFINAETLSGEYASSNHFRFRINLCVDCLLCAGDPNCTTPTSMVDACTQRQVAPPFTKLASKCWKHQDTVLECLKPDSNN